MKRFAEKTSELVKRREFDRVWQRHCGYLDLDLAGFMAIQRRLLQEQLELGKQSRLWRELFSDVVDNLTVDNFRELIPLTEYEDYAPYLEDKPSDILARPIKAWARTSGLGGKPKWIPYTEEMYEHLGLCSVTAGILSSARYKGDVRLRPGDPVGSNLPPRPYLSGISLWASSEFFDYHFIPPLDITEKMDFHERTEYLFRRALIEGLAFLGAMTIVLVRMGEMFEQGQRQGGFRWEMLHPKALWRVAQAVLRARRDGRRYILPKDLWQLKGLQCGGTDTFIYREQIIHYWGVVPHDVYACTEVGIMAMEAWDHTALTFLPETAFYEFIPYEDWVAERLQSTRPTRTLLMDEVQEGHKYEVVVTNFYGGALLRYRLHDLVEVVAMENADLGIRLPQFRFVGRSGSFIDLSGFAGLIDEKLLLQALAEVGIPYTDWCIRKEFESSQTLLHLYIEFPAHVSVDVTAFCNDLDETLKRMNPEYAHVEEMLGYRPLKVTLVTPGSFARFTQERLRAGADLAHLKPARIQPSDEALMFLLEKSAEMQSEREARKATRPLASSRARTG